MCIACPTAPSPCRPRAPVRPSAPFPPRPLLTYVLSGPGNASASSQCCPSARNRSLPALQQLLKRGEAPWVGAGERIVSHVNVTPSLCTLCLCFPLCQFLLRERKRKKKKKTTQQRLMSCKMGGVGDRARGELPHSLPLGVLVAFP